MSKLKLWWQSCCQISAVWIMTSIYFLGFVIFPALFLTLLFSPLFFLALIYLVFMYFDYYTPRKGKIMPNLCILVHAFISLNDDFVIELHALIFAFFKGGRKVRWINRGLFWRYFLDYFPIKIHKTAELDPDGHYLMGYHPHGLKTPGIFGLTANKEFRHLFPTINPYLATMDFIYKMPFLRDLSMAWGCISVNAESIEWMLQSDDTSLCPIIMIGGVDEMLYKSIPGTMNLTLKNRKGFVRLAIQNG